MDTGKACPSGKQWLVFSTTFSPILEKYKRFINFHWANCIVKTGEQLMLNLEYDAGYFPFS